mmetsp:Transcript_6316/g.19521  ORF Transcript_6316/g.19521 Transcript_6316/m.19521 type:complete len:247 (+) Transcript_6316:1482-2222(+)
MALQRRERSPRHGGRSRVLRVAKAKSRQQLDCLLLAHHLAATRLVPWRMGAGMYASWARHAAAGASGRATATASPLVTDLVEACLEEREEDGLRKLILQDRNALCSHDRIHLERKLRLVCTLAGVDKDAVGIEVGLVPRVHHVAGQRNDLAKSRLLSVRVHHAVELRQLWIHAMQSTRVVDAAHELQIALGRIHKGVCQRRRQQHTAFGRVLQDLQRQVHALRLACNRDERSIELLVRHDARILHL